MSDKRRCYLCEVTKPISDFIQRIDSRYYRMCRTCFSAVLKKRDGEKSRRLKHTKTHRTCYLCRRFLPVNQFTRRKTGTYFSACKDCNKNVFGPRRRARLNKSDGSFTTKEWEALLAKHKCCPGCKKPWDEIPPLPGHKTAATRDHIKPISKGGSNTIDNIQPLCYSCNSIKGAKLPG